MTDSQAEKIILLLESIDRRLKNVTEGNMTVDVTVTNKSLPVENAEHTSLTVDSLR